MATDMRSMPRIDLALIGLGVLVFIASFFPWYGYNFNFGGFGSGSASINSWHSWAVLALLLLLAGTVVAAVLIFAGANLPRLPVSWNFVVLALIALGTLIYIIRTFTLDTASGDGGSVGLKWGAYVVMIFALAQTVVAFLRLRESGEAMPWQGGAATSGGSAGAPPPPPPPPTA